MNIAIFDTEHFETTYPLIRLMQVPGKEIFVFTNLHCKERLEESLGQQTNSLRWIVQQENESHRQFIARMNAAIGELNIQLLFYNTVSNNHLLHAFLLTSHRSIRSVLTVHDINDFTRHANWLNPYDAYRTLGRRQLLKRVNELNVISDTMIPYLREKINKEVIIHNVPGAIFEHEPVALKVTGSINLVIPGTIDNKRRDYLQALELLIEADAAHVKLNITLLGAPYGKYGQDIIKAARKLTLKRGKINIYENEVPQTEFDEVLKHAHFVFIPSVQVSYSPDGHPEVYGQTKSSGGIFDAVRHGKPLIIPSFLAVPRVVETRCKRYTKVEELVPFLLSLMSDSHEYDRWQQRAIESSRHYTIETIRAGNPTLFY